MQDETKRVSADQTPLPNEQLRSLRLEHGWTLQQVADKLYDLCIACGKSESGINADTVGRWERGISIPRPFYQHHLSKLYGVPVAHLGFVSPRSSLTSIPPRLLPLERTAPLQARATARPVLMQETDTLHLELCDGALTIRTTQAERVSLDLSPQETDAVLGLLLLWKYGQQSPEGVAITDSLEPFTPASRKEYA